MAKGIAPTKWWQALRKPVEDAYTARSSYSRVESLESEFASRDDADSSKSVPWSLRVAASWGWRLLLLGAVIYAAVYLVAQIQIIILPVAIALLFAVILHPLMSALRRIRIGSWSMPAGAAAGIALVVGLSVIIGLLSAASTQILYGISALSDKAQKGFAQAINWLSTGPLRLDTSDFSAFLASFQGEVTSFLKANSSSLASGALQVTSSLSHLVTGALITLFCLFFFLKEGRSLWIWFVRMLPIPARVPVHEACVRGWVTLGAYARTQIIVAAVDSATIGIVAYIMGVPLALPLAVIIFLGSLIPIIGIIVTGSLAVAVALVDSGPSMALAMLIVIVVAYLVEGSLLQPLLMSGAVNLHPIAVLLAVTAGGYLAGIPGALFAVPIVAFINTVVLYLHGYDKFPQLSVDPNRAGGPPGWLDAAIAQTYHVFKDKQEKRDTPADPFEAAQTRAHDMDEKEQNSVLESVGEPQSDPPAGAENPQVDQAAASV